MSNPEIFFSYAWGDEQEKGESREKIVNDLYNSLVENHYDVVRDKYNLEYKGFITQFMTRIGEGKFIIVAISRKYLKSPYCMFELYEIARNSNFDKNVFREKVIPLIVERVDFTDPTVIDEHFLFWENEYNEWSDLVRRRTGQLSVEQLQRFDKIKMIYQNFGRLAEWIADMNTLNPQILSEDNFAAIKKIIGRKENVVVPDPKPLTRFLKMPQLWISALAVVAAILVITSWLSGNANTQKFIKAQTFKIIESAGEGLLIIQDLNSQKFGYARARDTSQYISTKYEQSTPFKHGLALVKMNGKYQWIRPDSNYAFPGWFDFAEIFQEGKARVAVGRDTFFINNKGNRIPLSVTIPTKTTTKGKGSQIGAQPDDPTNEPPPPKMCKVICETKGITGVEVSFMDPHENRRYSKVSGDGDLEFDVPCHLKDKHIEIRFKKLNRIEYRNFFLQNMEIPELFRD